MQRLGVPLLVLALLIPATVVILSHAQAANPPDPPVNIAPADGAAGVEANPSLCADVSDADGGTLNVTFQGWEISGGPSPSFYAQNLTDDSNQFALTYDMQGGLPFQVLGTATGVASGGTACVPWPGRMAGKQYEWFASASDGTASTAGTHSTFSSNGSCAVPADCEDGNPCTSDACDTGFCAYSPIANCCNQNGDCDDGNQCTADICSGANAAALTLNGTSDHVTMDAAPGLGAAQFTIETWFKQTGAGVGTSTGAGGLTSAVPLVSKGRDEADASDVDMNYFLGIQGGRLAADFEEALGVCSGGPTPGASCSHVCSNSAATPCSLDSQCPSGGTCTVHSCGAGGTCVGAAGLNHPVLGTATITNGVWHHAAATYDGSCWQLYLDGAPDGSSCPARPPRSDSIQHFGLGTAMTSSGAAAGFFAGALDEVRVWQRALTQAEILTGMNSQNVSDPDLIGHWSLNEGSGASAGDSAAPAENGSLIGAVWTISGLVSLGAGTCVAAPRAGCCLVSADCDDGNVCTSDACVGNARQLTPTANSCAADCNDGNSCTSDDCPPANSAALRFDGIDDYVDFGHAPAISNFLTGSFTIEGWINVVTIPSTNLTGIFRHGRQGNFPQVVVQLTGTAAPFNRLAASVETNVSFTQVDTSNTAALATVTAGQWTHFAAVVDRTPGNQQLRLYVNGVLASSVSGNVWGTNLISSTDNVVLGAARNTSGTLTAFYNGRIDELRIWSGARTAQQILDNMNTQISSAAGLTHRCLVGCRAPAGGRLSLTDRPAG